MELIKMAVTFYEKKMKDRFCTTGHTWYKAYFKITEKTYMGISVFKCMHVYKYAHVHTHTCVDVGMNAYTTLDKTTKSVTIFVHQGDTD